MTIQIKTTVASHAGGRQDSSSIEEAPTSERADDASPASAVPTMSVGAFLARVAGVLRANLPRQVWLEASVIAVRSGRYGHTLELVDPAAGQNASLRAFLPSAALGTIRKEIGSTFDPALLAGMSTVVLVEPSFDPRFHLGARIITLARTATASLRRRMTQQAAAALKREGLWDRQRRLPAPPDITRVAVVHPAGAAGWADVAARFSRWRTAGLLLIRSHAAAFEGDHAAAALVRALSEAAVPGRSGQRPDLVLLVRGGGAREGLAALDDESVARAICLCPVPVVCGTGHAIDTTLADGCAWRRADTPTAAAALVTGLIAAAARAAASDHAAIVAAALASVGRAEQRLQAAVGQLDADAARVLAAAASDLTECWSAVQVAAATGRGRLDRAGDRATTLLAATLARAPTLLASAADRLRGDMRDMFSRAGRAAERCDDGTALVTEVVSRTWAVLEREAIELAHLHEGVGRDALRRCADAAATLSREVLLVEAHDPAATLKRGYVLVSDATGRVLTNCSTAAVAQRLLLRFCDGAIAAVPEDVAPLELSGDAARLGATSWVPQEGRNAGRDGAGG